VQYELWKINQYKYDSPTTGKHNVIPVLQKTMAELAPETVHYAKVDLSVKRAAIAFPRQSTQLAEGASYIWMRGGGRVYGADLSKLVVGAVQPTSNVDVMKQIEVDEVLDE